MSKTIIDNRSDLSDYDALEMIMYVIASGRISNNGKQYCFLTVRLYKGKGYQIASYLNKKSDRFVINNN